MALVSVGEMSHRVDVKANSSASAEDALQMGTFLLVGGIFSFFFLLCPRSRVLIWSSSQRRSAHAT